MPRLHPVTGLAACGTAGGRISFGGKTGEQSGLCDGGCSFWLNADEIAHLGPLSGSWDGTPGGTAPQAVNIHTGARRPLERVEAGAALREASFFAAGGGRWQAAVAGQGGSFGSCGEFPGGTVSRAMTDGRGAAAQDGTIALVDVYQGTNNGFRLGRPDGSVTDRIAEGSDPYSLVVVDAFRAIWPTANRWGTFGIDPAPLWLKGSSGRACWCEVGGRAYLVHWLNGTGLVARAADSHMGKVLSPEDKEFHYDAVPWNGGIRIAWARVDGEPPGSLVVEDWDLQSDVVELAPPPPVAVIPTFSFAHPVMIVPFKDPEGHSGAGFEICVNAAGMKVARPHFSAGDSLNDNLGELLGIYSEASDKPADDLKLAASFKTRLLLCRDKPGGWTLPAGLRKWDIPARELYLVVGEAPALAPERWKQEVRALLQAWPGDCAVVPMFYCQGGRPPDDEVWPVADVCAGLASLSDIVNLSARIKVVAPFSYERANGIVGHVELQEAFANLKFAGWKAGVASLLPVEAPKPPDPPVTSLYRKHKEHRMSTKQTVAIVGSAGLYGRPGKPNSGPWAGLNRGWRGVIFDGVKDDSGALKSNKDPKVSASDYHFELSQPDDRHQLYHAGTDGFFGADATAFATAAGADQFYIKPAAETRGGYESPVIYEGNLTPKLLSGQIEYVANDGKGPAFVSCGFAVEVLS
jgi:hypothetical protein